MFNSYNPYTGMYGVASPQPSSFNQPQSNNMLGARQQVIRVNGKNGADAYQMPPNSSILLLDQTAPIVWLKMTDGAGYPTVTPYDIAPHQTEPQIQQTDIKAMEARITRLEDILNEQLRQSDTESSQPVKRIVTATRESKTN